MTFSYSCGLWEKIYLEAYINNPCIPLKNNTAELYFVLGKAELYVNFSSLHYVGMSLIFTDFEQCTWLRPSSCWEIWISEPSLGILENSNIAQLSLIWLCSIICERSALVIYVCLQLCFLINDLNWLNWLNFLQGVVIHNFDGKRYLRYLIY